MKNKKVMTFFILVTFYTSFSVFKLVTSTFFLHLRIRQQNVCFVKQLRTNTNSASQRYRYGDLIRTLSVVLSYQCMGCSVILLKMVVDTARYIHDSFLAWFNSRVFGPAFSVSRLRELRFAFHGLKHFASIDCDGRVADWKQIMKTIEKPRLDKVIQSVGGV